MILSAKDLLITNNDLIKTAKEAKNHNLCDFYREFTNVLRTEGCSAGAKPNQVVDIHSLEHRIKSCSENILNVCVDESTPIIGSTIKMDSNIEPENNREHEIKNVPYFPKIYKDEKNDVPKSSEDTLNGKMTDNLASCDEEADKERNYVEKNTHELEIKSVPFISGTLNNEEYAVQISPENEIKKVFPYYIIPQSEEADKGQNHIDKSIPEQEIRNAHFLRGTLKNVEYTVPMNPDNAPERVLSDYSVLREKETIEEQKTVEKSNQENEIKSVQHFSLMTKDNEHVIPIKPGDVLKRALTEYSVLREEETAEKLKYVEKNNQDSEIKSVQHLSVTIKNDEYVIPINPGDTVKSTLPEYPVPRDEEATKEHVIKNVPFFPDEIRDEKNDVPANSGNVLNIKHADYNVPLDEKAVNEQSFVDKGLPLPLTIPTPTPLSLNADNPEISDKGNAINMNMVTPINIDEKSSYLEANIKESQNPDFEKNNNINSNTYRKDGMNDLLTINVSNELNTDKPYEPYYAGNEGLEPGINKDSEKKDFKIASKTEERVPEVPVERVQTVTAKEVVEPAINKDTERDVAVRSSNDNNTPNNDADKSDYRYYSGNQHNMNPDKEANTSPNNDLDKDIAVNRPEFQDFMYRISEQRSFLSNDFLKNISKSQLQPQPQQMNLNNKGRAAFTESIGNVIRFIRAEGFVKAILIVDPPALGKVNIEIVSTDKGIEALLKVSNEQVKMLVQENSAQLKQNLEQAGVKLTEFSVDIQHDGSHSRDKAFDHGESKRANLDKTEDENEAERIETFRVDLRKGMLHWIA